MLLLSSLRFPNDDQFILYRYIDNIAAGHGFVYNLGQRVLGSTTPLFTLIASVLKILLPFAATPDIVATLNIVLVSFSAVVFYRLAKMLLPEHWSLFVVLVYVFNLARTIPEGMETPLFLLTVLLFLVALFKKQYYTSSVWLALTLLTRPDAGLIAMLTFCYWWSERGFKKALQYTATCILVAVPWLVFAYAYFGSIVPQSLATKLHSGDIYYQSAWQATKVQLAHLSRVYWGKLFDPNNIGLQTVINLFPLLFLTAVAAIRWLFTKFWILFAIPVVYFASFAISNPIVFPWYLSQMEPFWILLSGVGLMYVCRWIKNNWLVYALLIIVAIGPLTGWAHLVTTYDRGSKQDYFDIAQYLNEQNIQPTDTVGIADIGIVGYATKAEVIDFIGLTNTYAVEYYPVEDDCNSERTFYLVPPKLIMNQVPLWLVANENQLPRCFVLSDWFIQHYTKMYENPTAVVWRYED